MKTANDSVLIIKTSNDFITDNAMKFCQNNSDEVICLIQSSQLERYKKKHPHINFIDSKSESFYGLSSDIIQELSEKKYSMIVIPITGERAHNFGNIIEITRLLNHDKLVFYHSDDQIQIISRMNRIESKFIQIIIEVFDHLKTKKENQNVRHSRFH